ncbi:mitochondrial import inner membrane translocase subunit Tim21 isoform X2 [Narcine bancroftii]|uniref:mitochondrial import inner membrane translocase subunit Tim21 isoform X2 n=1 Tax=Narcine bancroftii TaxID=1343680 RepID=UPI00383145D8
MNLASVLFLRAVRTPTARAAPPFQRQFRIHDSGRTGLCSSVSARPGAATFSCWLQKLDSPNCFRSVSSLYIHTQTRRRTNEEVSDRKREHRVSIRRSPPLLSTARKVKEAGKDLTYLLVVLVGIGITGGLFYVIFKELFSSSSPNKIYGEALKKCKAHPEIIGVLGEPIKGYGETTRRGRRRHVRTLTVESTAFVIYLWTLTPIRKEPLLLKTTVESLKCTSQAWRCYHAFID